MIIDILKEEDGTKADRVATTAVVIGATTTLVVVINKVTEVAQCATISIRVAGQRHTVLIRVLADVSPVTQDGYRPSVDKVLFLLENQRHDDLSIDSFSVEFCLIYIIFEIQDIRILCLDLVTTNND